MVPSVWEHSQVDKLLKKIWNYTNDSVIKIANKRINKLSNMCLHYLFPHLVSMKTQTRQISWITSSLNNHHIMLTHTHNFPAEFHISDAFLGSSSIVPFAVEFLSR